MSVVQKLIDAQDNQDLKAYNEVLSEDYYWLRHSTGEKVPRDELSKWLISPDAPKTESSRIIYENDEIGVAHYFIFQKVLLLLSLLQILVWVSFADNVVKVKLKI